MYVFVCVVVVVCHSRLCVRVRLICHSIESYKCSCSICIIPNVKNKRDRILLAICCLFLLLLFCSPFQLILTHARTHTHTHRQMVYLFSDIRLCFSIFPHPYLQTSLLRFAFDWYLSWHSKSERKKTIVAGVACVYMYVCVCLCVLLQREIFS